MDKKTLEAVVSMIQNEIEISQFSEFDDSWTKGVSVGFDTILRNVKNMMEKCNEV